METLTLTVIQVETSVTSDSIPPSLSRQGPVNISAIPQQCDKDTLRHKLHIQQVFE